MKKEDWIFLKGEWKGQWQEHKELISTLTVGLIVLITMLFTMACNQKNCPAYAEKPKTEQNRNIQYLLKTKKYEHKFWVG